MGFGCECQSENQLLKLSFSTQRFSQLSASVGELGTFTQSISSFGIFFFLDFFFWGIGPRGLAPPLPQECNSILPLVTVVLITPKGAEPPGSRRIGVIGALVLILPSETV